MLYSVQEAPILPQSVNLNLPTIYPLWPRQQIYTLISPATGPGSKRVTPPITRKFGHPFLMGRGFTDLCLGTRLTEHLRPLVYLWPVRRPYGSSYGPSTVYWKAVWFIYGPSAGYTAYLRSVGRPYGLFTARWKAVRLTLRTVSRAYGRLRAPFGRQPKRYFGRNFLYISFVFYSLFLNFFCIL